MLMITVTETVLKNHSCKFTIHHGILHGRNMLRLSMKV